MTAERDPKMVVTRAIEEVWNTGDVDAFDVLLADGYVRHGRSGDSTKDTLKRTIAMSRKAFPYLRTHIEHIVHEGNLLATHWQSSGTHRGQFPDLPITGTSIVITGLTLSRVVAGGIVEEWNSGDHTDFFAELGVVNVWDAR